ncbi:type II secretion system protein M [Serratia nevei]|uniref:type II secretion system protein M n=1 Tax=Serratia nevei TaxID=2703794 RepID=UPI00209DACEB|nr:type II secretion system protein M [Serratia nevei]MCP1104150.1 type II secretion system protein M [Serratia nevei]
MTYNQKAWLGVVLLCALFWLAVIGSVCPLYNRVDRLNARQPQSEFTDRHSLDPCTPHGAQVLAAPRNG